MALTVERITLPSGPGSLRQVTQSPSGLHVLRIDASGREFLVELGGKKPVIHEFPIKSLPDSNLAICICSAAWSPDGKHFAFLEQSVAKERAPHVVVYETATRNVVASLKIKADSEPRYVQWHGDGQRLFVYVKGETQLINLKGKVVETFETPRTFDPSPSGERFLYEVAEQEWIVQIGKKKTAKFEARDIMWADEETIVMTRFATNETQHVLKAPAATGKAKKIITLPDASSIGAAGNVAVAVEAGEKKVFAHVIDLKTGKKQSKELQGAPSGTAISVSPTQAFVQVNWAKALHHLKF